MTPTAHGEMWAARIDPLGRRFEDFHESGARPAFAFVDDFYAYRLAGQGEGREGHPAVLVASEGLPTVSAAA